MNDSDLTLVLEKACTVHLKPEGEICNRLQKGRQVHLVQRKGSWVKITWRNGKKKGWVDLSLQKNA